MENLEQINNSISELQEKYDSLLKRLDSVEEENAARDFSIQELENSFQTINNNLNQLVLRVDSIADEKQPHKVFTTIKKSNFSIINMITTPMRKATINTMSTFFTVADYASQKVNSVKEELEDIITEAQSESHKRKLTTISKEHL